MNFTLVDWNHGGRGNGFVADHLRLLRLLVEAAGHRLADPPGGRGPYVFLECFKPSDVARIGDLARAGLDLIIVASEFLTGQTFNDFGGGGGGHYSNRPYWQARFENFQAAARLARAIWCSSDDPEQIAAYQALLPEVPVVRLPFPHFRGFPHAGQRKTKDIDLLFWGNRTTHRTATMARLAQRHAIEFPRFLPDADRRELVARSKIGLNLKQSPGWPFPSTMRYWVHLSQASCLVGEQCQRACVLDKYVRTVPSQELDSTCRELLEGGEWQRLAAEGHERFAAECPAKAAAEELLERTFGEVTQISPAERAAGDRSPPE